MSLSSVPSPDPILDQGSSSDILRRMHAWWYIYRIALEERLAYRGDFALGTLMRFLPIITQVFLWWAIYESMPEKSIAGYSFRDMIAYYLLSMIARAFSSMPGLASQIAKQIREGEIKKFIIQPIDLVGFMLLGRAAHKTAYYAVAAGPFALVFFLCRGYFEAGWPSGEVLIAFLISLIFAFFLGFFLDLCIGLIGFWFLEVSSLLFLYMLLNFFLSGHMFPIDIVGEPWVTIFRWLPFQYLSYFPAAVFLEKIPHNELWYQIGIEAIWLVAMIGLARLLYARGLHRYSGFGG